MIHARPTCDPFVTTYYTMIEERHATSRTSSLFGRLRSPMLRLLFLQRRLRLLPRAGAW